LGFRPVAFRRDVDIAPYDYASDFYVGVRGDSQGGACWGRSPLHPLERVFGYFLHEQKVTPVRQDKVGGLRPQKTARSRQKFLKFDGDNSESIFSL